jgi:glycosyltransferase involved in cell wall biosynthesis
MAEAFAFPSLYEGFGLPALEAMACGTPVVASDRSSLPEVVGDAGLLVNPEKEVEIAGAIDKLLSDADLRSKLVEAGKERAGGFSWEHTARETLAVYREASQ